MALFRNRRPRPARRRGGDPDPAFAHMTRREGDELRRELRAVLREYGAAVHFDGDQAVISRGRRGEITVSLTRLARDVAISQHPKAARQFSRAFADTVFADPHVTELSAAEIYAGLRPRIAPTEKKGRSTAAQRIIDSATLRPFTSDTVVTLALDTPQAVQTVSLDRLRAVDGVDSLERAARTNLRSELVRAEVTAHLHTSADNHPGARFWSFESDNVYTSCAALMLEETIGRWAPKFDASQGVLFAMPNSYVLLARPVTAGEDLVEGISRMAPVAVETAIRSEHPVSPLLHLSHLGEVDTISSLGEDDRHLRISPTDYLLHLMRTES